MVIVPTVALLLLSAVSHCFSLLLRQQLPA